MIPVELLIIWVYMPNAYAAKEGKNDNWIKMIDKFNVTSIFVAN